MITDKKISAGDYTGNDVTGLVDRPSEAGMSALQLKQRFDSLFKNILTPKYNALIDVLASVFGASNIGFSQTAKAPYDNVQDAVANAYNYANQLVTDAELGTVLPKAENISILDTGEHYTGATVELALAEVATGKSAIGHTHDDRYYTEDELNAGQLNNLYFTEQEVTDALALKAVKSGWEVLGVSAYVSADAPTFVMNVTGDYTAILTPGMRIKITQDASTKYFIVTAVGAFAGGFTPITMYGGTDYTLSANPVTNPFYSGLKAPFGFPLSHTKWTINVVYDTTNKTTATPTQNVIYTLFTFHIPIGLWDINISATVGGGRSTVAQLACVVGLSSSTSSYSNLRLKTNHTVYSYLASFNAQYTTKMMRCIVALTAKTEHYIITSTTQTGMDALYLNGIESPTVVDLICAYL